MGLRHMTSIKGYSWAKLFESSLLKAFVAEYRVTYGIDFSPRKEERLIMALRMSLLLIIFATSAERAAIEMQLILMISLINSNEQFSKCFISDVPTLLTNKAISNYRNCDIKPYHFIGSELSLKSNTIDLNSLVAKWAGRQAKSDSLVFSNFSALRDIKTTLNPNCVRTSQKPSPMPSVAPVTTAQLRLLFEQYLLKRSGMGVICLTIVAARSHKNLTSGSNTIAATIIFQLHSQG